MTSTREIPTTNEDLAVHPTMFAADLLEDQVVIVAGGGSGIGRATAWLAARLGAQVVICGRTEAKLQVVADAISEQGLKADIQVIDIRQRPIVDSAMEAIWARHQRVDLLINSAGGQFPQASIDFSEKGWNAVINTNLNGTWHMMQSAAQRWRESSQAGSIVNIIVVTSGLYGVAHTNAARAGVTALSQCVAVEWAEFNVRVNCIAPGTVQTEGWAVYSEEAKAKYPLTNPLMRVGSPWEIAEAAIFIGGPGGRYINGEVLNVDGGGQHWGEIWTAGKPDYYAAATRKLDDGSS